MKKVVFLVFIFFSTVSYSQKEANFWYFGQNAALDFNSGTPLPTGSASSNQLSTVEGCSTFSDANGNLLFYIGAPTPTSTNLTIWNRNNQPMPFSDVNNGGQLLNGDASSSQSALTVPAPNQPNIYYIFTVGAQSSGNAGFWFYTVDMNANGGLGDIVSGPIALNNGILQQNWTEKVTAVRGEECNTFWVISYVNGDFISYKVDINGVDITNPVISSLGNTSFNFSNTTGGLDARGYLKVSPDGTKLVAANMTSGTFFFDFDDTTGLVSNPRELNIDNRNGYGVEFSPSSNRLYVSTGNFTNSTEFLYQFDVSTNDIAAINNSRFTVFSYFNSRGALQLGPDNRIYWTSDQSQNISVINNPEELGTLVNYQHQSVNVGAGRLATQGLPPFLSSLLLPISITDSDTNLVLNNQTISFCTGDNKILVPDNIIGNNITYEWSFNNGSGPVVIATSQNLTLTNLTSANAGTYLLEVLLTDDCGINTTLRGEFNVDIFENATANQNVSEVLFCDVDNDGFNIFDLSTLKDAEILDGQDPAVFEVFYYLTESDALTNLNPLSVPYTNPTPFSDQTLWARVQNRNASAACFEVTSFRLAVTGLPVPTAPTDYVICDNDSDGNDTNGFVQSFVLNTKDSEILGNLNPAQYTVSYHLTADNALTNSNAIDKVNPYTNGVSNLETIFVRVENVDNPACFDASISFSLIVGALPVLENQIINIEECDFDGVLDGIANVNLTQVNNQVSLNANSFTYFPSLANAQNNTNEINNPSTYRNENSPTNFSYWVRALSSESCFRIARVDVLVSAVGSIPQGVARNYFECDDFLDIDGNDNANNSDTDGVTAFDFSDAIPEIRALFPPTENIEITFYRTQLDADLKTNAIADITNYRNIGFPFTQIVYVRADNVDQSSCEGVSGYIQLNVNPVPTAEPVSNIIECDNNDDGVFNNGIIQTFNLDIQTPIILGTQDPANFTVTYHTRLADSQTGNNAIANTASYENSIRDLQTIFVRVTNNTTNCFTNHTTFDLIVNPLPIANPVGPIEICDDNTDGDAQNGFSQSIPIRALTEADILGTQSATLYTVSYHTTIQNAENGVSPLNDVISNQILTNNIVYVRVINNSTQCVNAISQFSIIVNPEPIVAANVSDFIACDDDSNGVFRDGIISGINLESKIGEILPNSNLADFRVTFHETSQGAIDNDNSIPSNQLYQNTTPYRQTIFVRVENIRTTCVNDEELTFDIVINDPPNFDVLSPQIVCLNSEGLTLSIENPSGVFDYFWTNNTTGATTNGETLLVTAGGSYTVTATSIDGTNCTYSETIVVNESNVATLERSFITIYDETNNNGVDKRIFLSIDTENNNLGPGDYQFALLNTDNGSRIPTVGYQESTLFENLEGGVYQVIVNDKNGCIPDTKLLVSIIEFPKFFTPNGDNIKDTWSVKGANLNFFPNSKVTIFNRFGKVVAKIPVDGPGWDGTFNGRVLPSDDYWFSFQYLDANGNVKEKTGNFSLLRK